MQLGILIFCGCFDYEEKWKYKAMFDKTHLTPCVIECSVEKTTFQSKMLLMQRLSFIDKIAYHLIYMCLSSVFFYSFDSFSSFQDSCILSVSDQWHNQDRVCCAQVGNHRLRMCELNIRSDCSLDIRRWCQVLTPNSHRTDPHHRPIAFWALAWAFSRSQVWFGRVGVGLTTLRKPIPSGISDIKRGWTDPHGVKLTNFVHV